MFHWQPKSPSNNDPGWCRRPRSRSNSFLMAVNNFWSWRPGNGNPLESWRPDNGNPHYCQWSPPNHRGTLLPFDSGFLVRIQTVSQMTWTTLASPIESVVKGKRNNSVWTQLKHAEFSRRTWFRLCFSFSVQPQLSGNRIWLPFQFQKTPAVRHNFFNMSWLRSSFNRVKFVWFKFSESAGLGSQYFTQRKKKRYG